ncbi:hypothetical protein EV360DRAFT_85451 [Lentinula raphanica]|nr:hypothetical protein EV360DRAFT_85451 [Lentinula raphanica]
MTRPVLVLPLGIILIILASTVSLDVLAAPTSSNGPGRDTTYASNGHSDSVDGARDSPDVYDRVSSYQVPSADASAGGADGSPARQSLTGNSLRRRTGLTDDPILSSRAVAPEHSAYGVPGSPGRGGGGVLPFQAAAGKTESPIQNPVKDMADLKEYDTKLTTVYEDMTSIKPQGTKDINWTPAYANLCSKYRDFIETMNDRVPLILESAQPSTELHDKAKKVDESLQGLFYVYASTKAEIEDYGTSRPVFGYVDVGTDSGAYSALGASFFAIDSQAFRDVAHANHNVQDLKKPGIDRQDTLDTLFAVWEDLKGERTTREHRVGIVEFWARG